MIFAVNTLEVSGDNKKTERGRSFVLNQNDCAFKRPTSVYIATTTGEPNEASSDAHTEDYIPLETATPAPTPTSTFPDQCSQPSLQPPNLIEKLNDKEKEAVKEIGFGGFLSLQVDMIPRKSVVWLRISEHDVYMTLAPTKGPLEVTKAKSETNSSTQVDRGEEFKRNFIVFAMSTCINGNQRGELCYLYRVVFKVRTFKRQFPTLRGWTNDKMKSKEEQEFEVSFSNGVLKDRLDETKMPDEAQAIHEEEPSNVTPKPAAEAEHDTVRSKVKALLEDAKKVSNETITNTRVWHGLGLSREENEPTATQIFIREAEHQEKSVAPATRVVIRELDVDVPLRDVQEASHVGIGKAIMEEVSRRLRMRFMQYSTMQVPTEAQGDSVAPVTGIVIRELDANVPMQRHYGGSVNKTNNEVHAIQLHVSANSFVARVIVVDYYSSFSSKECLRDRQVLALR
ncbi:hypothetical protein Cgig2_011597 [Carnegiea gigantea]|uniref:Uncharacterized protein n=1 Tax=Carnegiea gigantea TaxID=171969 RepID=A0A9Q1JIF0_9CARY|nr:hypothetical protein Cgig2_011597 [Carnegiea gigantea]